MPIKALPPLSLCQRDLLLHCLASPSCKSLSEDLPPPSTLFALPAFSMCVCPGSRSLSRTSSVQFSCFFAFWPNCPCLLGKCWGTPARSHQSLCRPPPLAAPSSVAILRCTLGTFLHFGVECPSTLDLWFLSRIRLPDRQRERSLLLIVVIIYENRKASLGSYFHMA